MIWRINHQSGASPEFAIRVRRKNEACGKALQRRMEKPGV